MPTPTSSTAPAESLCLACGLCCNGVLFRDVEVREGDDAARLKALGLPVKAPRTAGKPSRFAQPCAALCADGRCGIYLERPSRCRNFECALLKSVIAGRVPAPGALRVIQQTKRRAETVRRLLHALDNHEDQLPLSARFRRVKKRIESAPLDHETADAYGELTLAIHDLNVLLHQHFHVTEAAPGS